MKISSRLSGSRSHSSGFVPARRSAVCAGSPRMMSVCTRPSVLACRTARSSGSGWSVDLPAKVHKTLDERTDPGWPTTWFAPRLTGKGAFTDVYSVMANMGANHGAFTYGHIGADILTLASMLRIPVYAHNIPDDQIYRPSAWGLHGTADPEGADFRACANYGPLYGKY